MAIDVYSVDMAESDSGLVGLDTVDADSTSNDNERLYAELVESASSRFARVLEQQSTGMLSQQ